MFDLEKTVLSAIGEFFSIDPSELDVDMVADDVDGWDSLSHVTVILVLSRLFDINISPTETEDLANIRDLVEVIRSKIGG